MELVNEKPDEQELCYMCGDVASTREHVPPRAFFPRAMRANLWTVPSCTEHNNNNNLDIEYVRNVISIQRGTNATAEGVLEVVKRSWDHSPALLNRTVRELRAVHVEGEEAGVFPIELQRVKSIMVAIVHALSWRDFRRAYIGEWHVFCATLGSLRPLPDWDNLRRFLHDAVYEPIKVPAPEVFEHGIHRTNPVGFIYRLVFYGGFVVYAWPVIHGREAART
jgi:hypothetical protein